MSTTTTTTTTPQGFSMTVTPLDPSRGLWFQTASGRIFYPHAPRAEDVFLGDIARSLSMQCRFNGHCEAFYSVAEHSRWVSLRVAPVEELDILARATSDVGKQAYQDLVHTGLFGLMHDAAEAYCCDIPRPLKVDLPGYKEIEERNWLAVCDAFALNPELPQCVHDADVAMLYAERVQVMHPALASLEDWGMGLKSPIDASKVRIFGYMPGRASSLFLKRFHELGGKHHG